MFCASSATLPAKGEISLMLESKVVSILFACEHIAGRGRYRNFSEGEGREGDGYGFLVTTPISDRELMFTCPQV